MDYRGGNLLKESKINSFQVIKNFLHAEGLRFWFKNQFIPKKMNFMLTGVINRVVDLQKFAKAGFTLAEVLITLCIIGIVAAMTLPNLISNYQKRVTVNRLKTSYSKLMQAFKAAEDDYGPVTEWELSNTDATEDFWVVYRQAMNELVKKRIIPYAKVIDDCGLNCPQRNLVKICRLNGNCTKGHVHPMAYYTVYLADGSSWEFMIDNNRGVLTIIKVYIDINGNGRPNTFGKDIFTISFKEGSSLLGASSKYKRENLFGNCRECCSKTAGNYAGDYCGGIIQRDGWVISADYPWK